MATVNKNFRIKNGLIVEGGTATVGGFGVLTKAQADQDYIVSLIGGTATSANEANKVVKRDANGNFAAGTITATFVGNVTGTVSSLSNHDTDDLAEGSNLYFTNARALSATSAAYDAAGSAAGAQAAAISAAASDATSKVAAEAALRVSGDAASVATAASDATSKANAAQAAAEATAAADATSKANAAQAAAISAAATDATGKANAAQAAAEATAAADATSKANAAQAAAIAAAATAAGSAISAAISTEVSDRNAAITSAVNGVIDGAPGILDTLNEIANAIADDANYATTMTTALATKAPLASPALTGTPTAPTAAADTNTTQIATTAFAKGEADAAQAAAEATAAADATSKVAAEAALRVSGDAASVATAASDATSKANAAQAAAEATAAAANTAQQNGTTAFTAINYNDVAKQVAATTGNIAVAAETTAIAWTAVDYRSAKLVVKVKNGVHTQVSDLVITLDTANNVAVSEYGITYSNGTELAAVTADYSGTDVRVRVTPANANTEVVVVGTLIK
jgi:hypothetical protein